MRFGRPRHWPPEADLTLAGQQLDSDLESFVAKQACSPIRPELPLIPFSWARSHFGPP